jgi:hypothetical protein
MKSKELETAQSLLADGEKIDDTIFETLANLRKGAPEEEGPYFDSLDEAAFVKLNA